MKIKKKNSEKGRENAYMGRFQPSPSEKKGGSISHDLSSLRRRHITWSFLITDGDRAYHMIFPSHWDCEHGWWLHDGELDNKEEVWWTKHQGAWLTLGLRVDWHRLFQTVWPGDRPRAGDSFLTSSVPSLISGPSPSHWPLYCGQLPSFTSGWKSLSSRLRAEKKKSESGGLSLAFAAPGAHAI